MHRHYVQADTLLFICLLLYEDADISGTSHFMLLDSTLGVWQVHNTTVGLIFLALIISLSVLKNVLENVKMSKSNIFNHFCPFSGALKQLEEILRNNQIFRSFSTPCTSSTEKNGDGNTSSSVQNMYQKMQKQQKMTIFSHFCPFSQALKLFG